MQVNSVLIPQVNLKGHLSIPVNSTSLVVFIHGSGSDRFSVRNKLISNYYNQRKVATLLIDLLNDKEKVEDRLKEHLRYDLELLTKRLVLITRWVLDYPSISQMNIGYLGSSTGAAAAFNASINFDRVKVMVLRGGRTDLAEPNILEKIRIPTLFVVGEKDLATLLVNKKTFSALSNCNSKDFAVIPKASHFFEEQGKMDEVADVTYKWYSTHLLKEDRIFVNPYNNDVKNSLFNTIKSRRLNFKLTNRYTAGNILADLLSKYKKYDDIALLAIPRGGIIIASEVCYKLSLKGFNIIVSRRLRSPYFSEDTIGSILQDGSIFLTPQSRVISKEYIEMEIQKQKKELAKLVHFYKIDDQCYDLKGKTILLVDDGSYSGSTLYNICKWLTTFRPSKIVVAIPIISKQAYKLLNTQIKDIYYIYKPRNFTSVEAFYDDFSLPSQFELLRLINSSNTNVHSK